MTRRETTNRTAPPAGPPADPIGDRVLPTERGVVPARPDLGGGAATPSFAEAAGRAGPSPETTVIGGRRFEWGERTFVMGVLNVTPDSFSGDGLLAGDERLTPGAIVARALDIARRMVADGADILDVGGESSRPGHAAVAADEETRRIVPVIEAVHAALPDLPISVDTTKTSVATAALDAGAALLNDAWGVAPDGALGRLAAERGVPIVLMHNRAEARYSNLLVEVLAELELAVRRTVAAGVAPENVIVDPGFGFGKAPVHNIALLAGLDRLRMLGRPVLLGTSRKSTLGKVLDLPPAERLEATLATTALAIRAGVDIVRVHDVGPNVRVARMADAIVRGWHPPAGETA
jgi:dihydropteroate synthase